MYITAQGPRLRNDLYCVEWDVKLYYTIPYLGDVQKRTVGHCWCENFFTHQMPFLSCNSVQAQNNSNNNHDDIYSAVVMTEVIARVHSVYLMNVEQR